MCGNLSTHSLRQHDLNSCLIWQIKNPDGEWVFWSSTTLAEGVKKRLGGEGRSKDESCHTYGSVTYMTRAYVRHDFTNSSWGSKKIGRGGVKMSHATCKVVCLTWLVHMCDMICSYTCDMTHLYGGARSLCRFASLVCGITVFCSSENIHIYIYIYIYRYIDFFMIYTQT